MYSLRVHAPVVFSALLGLLGLGAVLFGAPAQDPALTRLTRILGQAPEFRLRVSAARALGILKDPAALPALISALNTDSDFVVRGAAAWALGNINHPGALGALDQGTALENAFASGQARRAAAHIRLKLPGNLPPFTQGWWRIDPSQSGATPSVPGALKAALPAELAARLGAFPNVRLGTQDPAPGDEDKPFIGLRLGTTIKTALAAPGGRGTCRVTVEGYFSLEGQALPVTRRLERSGTAEAGGSVGTKEALGLALGVALEGLIIDLTAAIGQGGSR